MTSPTNKHHELPFQGCYHQSKEKKFKEVVVFVPWFAGQPPALKRHIELVNSLGYDCVTFHLEWNPLKYWTRLSSTHQLGLRARWEDQIDRVLSELPGDKILFAFSSPSAAALAVIARRQAKDIRCLVIDSGPSYYLWTSIFNYFTEHKKISLLPKRLLVTSMSAASLSFRWQQDLNNALSNIPKDFPILSIRGWKDQLIPPKYIDAVFDPHPHLIWQKLNLPQAAHLNGLRDFAADYTPPLTLFLKKHSSAF